MTYFTLARQNSEKFIARRTDVMTVGWIPGLMACGSDELAVHRLRRLIVDRGAPRLQDPTAEGHQPLTSCSHPANAGLNADQQAAVKRCRDGTSACSLEAAA